MKNIFQIVFDQMSKTSSAEYEKYIIRRLSKKEEEKINKMSNQYNSAEQKLALPKWLYFCLRISFMGMSTSFLLWFLLFFTEVKNGFVPFLQKYLWLEIIFLAFLGGLLVSILASTIFKKRKKSIPLKKNAEDIFADIVKESKKGLKVPDNAVGLEVLMSEAILKKNGLKEPKSRFFSNVVLNAFIENDMLCLADLYVVIGIPLNEIKGIEAVKEVYRFQYWHKKSPIQEFQDYGVKQNKTAHCYQGNGYFVIPCFTDLAFYISPYEYEEWKNLLNIQ